MSSMILSSSVREVAKSRRTLDAGGKSKGGESEEVCDFVAQIPRNRAKDISSATFQCIPTSSVRAKTNVYSVKNWGCSCEKVVLMGKEVEPPESSFDYAIAVVNRKSRLVDYVPAKLVSFEPLYSPNPELLFSRRGPTVDYSADHSIAKESWADKRRALTSEFGSVKKLKAQNAAVRREIKNETLAVMINRSVDASLIGEELEDVKTEVPVSLVVKPSSSVLPAANESAKSPSEVYSFKLFLSDEEINEMKKETVEFLKLPAKELTDGGFPAFVYRMKANIGNSEESLCLLVLLAVMVQCYQIVGKPAKRGFTLEDWTSLHYPSGYEGKMREVFFGEKFGREAGDPKTRSKICLFVNPIEKDRLLAHILCLALLFDRNGYRLPITRWAEELKVSEARIVKTATALGCSVSNASQEEGISMGTTRIARLVGPPSMTVRKTNFKKLRK